MINYDPVCLLYSWNMNDLLWESAHHDVGDVVCIQQTTGGKAGV